MSDEYQQTDSHEENGFEPTEREWMAAQHVVSSILLSAKEGTGEIDKVTCERVIADHFSDIRIAALVHAEAEERNKWEAAIRDYAQRVLRAPPSSCSDVSLIQMAENYCCEKMLELAREVTGKNLELSPPQPEQ